MNYDPTRTARLIAELPDQPFAAAIGEQLAACEVARKAAEDLIARVAELDALVKSVQSAHGTDETGNDLIVVCRDAHNAELREARKEIESNDQPTFQQSLAYAALATELFRLTQNGGKPSVDSIAAVIVEHLEDQRSELAVVKSENSDLLSLISVHKLEIEVWEAERDALRTALSILMARIVEWQGADSLECKFEAPYPAFTNLQEALQKAKQALLLSGAPDD